MLKIADFLMHALIVRQQVSEVFSQEVQHCEEYMERLDNVNNLQIAYNNMHLGSFKSRAYGSIYGRYKGLMFKATKC